MPQVQRHTLGRRPYREVHAAMAERVNALKGGKLAELWLVEHDPVFTQGQAGRPEHVLDPGDIPVVQSDRGGQVTYHGPGQVVLYTLIPLKAFALNVRQLVSLLESSVVDCLQPLGIESAARPDAPGVYVGEAKIASLGLRIRHGVSFHGVALNVAMDLAPFARINPCGYSGLEVTQVSDHTAKKVDPETIGLTLAAHVEGHLMARL